MIDALRQTLQTNFNVGSDKKKPDEDTINPPSDAKPFDLKSEYSMIQNEQGSFNDGDYRRVRESQNQG